MGPSIWRGRRGDFSCWFRLLVICHRSPQTNHIIIPISFPVQVQMFLSVFISQATSFSTSLNKTRIQKTVARTDANDRWLKIQVTVFSGECLNLCSDVDIRKVVGWVWIGSIYSVRYLSLYSVLITLEVGQRMVLTRLVLWPGDGPINRAFNSHFVCTKSVPSTHLVSL